MHHSLKKGQKFKGFHEESMGFLNRHKNGNKNWIILKFGTKIDE